MPPLLTTCAYISFTKSNAAVGREGVKESRRNKQMNRGGTRSEREVTRRLELSCSEPPACRLASLMRGAREGARLGGKRGGRPDVHLRQPCPRVSYLCMPVHTNAPSIKPRHDSKAIYSRVQVIVRERREGEGRAAAEVVVRVHGVTTAKH